jgi:hypothetical protein
VATGSALMLFTVELRFSFWSFEVSTSHTNDSLSLRISALLTDRLLFFSWAASCHSFKDVPSYTWFDNKVRGLIAVKLLHTLLVNITVVAYKVLSLGSYAPMAAPSPPSKNFGIGFVEYLSELLSYYS